MAVIMTSKIYGLYPWILQCIFSQSIGAKHGFFPGGFAWVSGTFSKCSVTLACVLDGLMTIGYSPGDSNK